MKHIYLVTIWKSWNYYNNIEHITNNASESLNNSLNKLFPMKPNFYELINKLKEQEHLSYYDYQMKIKGIELFEISSLILSFYNWL